MWYKQIWQREKNLQNYNILVSEPEGKRHTGDLGMDKDKIKIHVKETGGQDAYAFMIT